MLLQQTSWSQSTLPKSDPNSQLAQYRKAIVNCDNANKRLTIDLQIAIESDSMKTILLGMKDVRIKNDSVLYTNLKKQIDNANLQIVELTAIKTPKKSKWWLYGAGGAIVGYLIRNELKALISRL